MALGACAGSDRMKPGNWQSTTNEATIGAGAGNTGHAGAVAPGPAVNSESRKEAAREGR